MGKNDVPGGTNDGKMARVVGAGGLRRQEMNGLVLDVDASGEVIGSGEDCVGEFTFSGAVAPEVTLVKQYLGRHRVLYVGTNTGEGMFGTWRLPGMPSVPGLTSGRFALFPARESGLGSLSIRELHPVGGG